MFASYSKTRQAFCVLNGSLNNMAPFSEKLGARSQTGNVLGEPMVRRVGIQVFLRIQ